MKEDTTHHKRGYNQPLSSPQHPFIPSAMNSTRNWNDRVITAIDAQIYALDEPDFSSSKNIEDLLMQNERKALIRQLHQKCLLRELNKAFCGFQSAVEFTSSKIATGHWGESESPNVDSYSHTELSPPSPLSTQNRMWCIWRR